MKQFHKVLFVHEPGADSAQALDRAMRLARDNQATLTVVDVVELAAGGLGALPRGLTREGLLAAMVEEREEQLNQWLAPLREHYAVTAEVLSGTPYLAIIRKVMREGFDVVIKPVQSGVGLKARLFGSTDLHLLRKCPVPVWLMKPTADGKLHKVLAAVDIGHDDEPGVPDALSLEIVDLASGVALTESSELHLVHAWQAMGEQTLRSGRGGYSLEELEAYVAEEHRRHQLWVEQLFSAVREVRGGDILEYLKPQIHTPKGWARDVIPQLAEDIDADLVVMGTVARTGIPGFIMGNTAEVILNSINCSVLAVKPEGFVSPVTLED